MEIALVYKQLLALWEYYCLFEKHCVWRHVFLNLFQKIRYFIYLLYLVALIKFLHQLIILGFRKLV